MFPRHSAIDDDDDDIYDFYYCSLFTHCCHMLCADYAQKTVFHQLIIYMHLVLAFVFHSFLCFDRLRMSTL